MGCRTSDWHDGVEWWDAAEAYVASELDVDVDDQWVGWMLDHQVCLGRATGISVWFKSKESLGEWWNDRREGVIQCVHECVSKVIKSCGECCVGVGEGLGNPHRRGGEEAWMSLIRVRTSSIL